MLIFTLLMAATSWADEFKQKKFEGVEIDEIPDQTYTADSICPTPDIDVPDSLKPFVKDTDYKVYCYDNVNAGEATLVIEGIGKYAGTIETIFIINKAPLTVTAKNDTITYGDEPSNAGVEYSGFVGDDNENDLNDSIAFNYDYVQFDKVGKYVIIPGGLSS
ncbi:MAG: MBG domain-containing protein, partial [Fibrobacter sp.]|uniref:MBG domain-containing protein n=1 Tax=Fibrobacter sp. TaxID=35828 RepID=UPI002A915D7E